MYKFVRREKIGLAMLNFTRSSNESTRALQHVDSKSKSNIFLVTHNSKMCKEGPHKLASMCSPNLSTLPEGCTHKATGSTRTTHTAHNRLQFTLKEHLKSQIGKM